MVQVPRLAGWGFASELLRDSWPRPAARWLWVSIQRDEGLSEAEVRAWWP